MSRTPTPPVLSDWRDRIDERADRARSSVMSSLPPALRIRVRRLRYALLPILQCGVAAGVAWFVAADLVGHERPFFAPIAAAIALGTGMGKRLRRGFEIVVGVVIGVGLGDLIIGEIGSGAWQIALAVVVAMSVAVFLDDGPLVAIQASSSAILVTTLIPPGSAMGYERMVDAAIGGAIGILAMALAPVHPLRRARREAAALIGRESAVLALIASGLKACDPEPIREALQEARDTQPAIDGLREQLDGGRELVRISPLYRHRRQELDAVDRLMNPLDNGVRNIRVLARRALTSVEDSVDLSDDMVATVHALGEALEELGHVVAKKPSAADGAQVTRTLRSVAARARREMLTESGLTETVLLAQIRSILVDMLQVAGMSKISALATLPPTVSRPAVRPDVLETQESELTEAWERPEPHEYAEPTVGTEPQYRPYPGERD